MNGQPKGGGKARSRVITAAVCSVLIAAGGVLAGTPASASSCVTSVPVTGLMQTLGGASNVLGCVTGPGETPTPAPSDTASPSPSPTSTAVPSDDTSSTGTVSASSASSTRLADLSLARSSNTVYPVKDGYEDTVRFGVWGSNVVGGSVPVVGIAELTHAGKIVKTWHIDGSHSVITWNGRVGTKVQPGLYTLAATAWSPDGSTVRAVSMVRVLSQHLVKHTLVVRSNVGSRSVSADLPRQLLRAYATGEVFCRVRTVASVSGPAKLVFSQNGISRSVVLRNGTHTTKPLPVPQGFAHVTISHAWKKGDAKLHSLKAIWTYYTLQ